MGHYGEKFSFQLKTPRGVNIDFVSYNQ